MEIEKRKILIHTDYETKRIRITFESPNMAVEFNSPDGHLLDWNAMSRNEQIKALNGLANAYHLFKKTLKNE